MARLLRVGVTVANSRAICAVLCALCSLRLSHERCLLFIGAQDKLPSHFATRESARAAFASGGLSQLAKAVAAVKGAGMGPVAAALKAVVLAVWPLMALAVFCAAVDAARKAALSVEQVGGTSAQGWHDVAS